MIDDLRALYLSAYATDQIDVTEQWKVPARRAQGILGRRLDAAGVRAGPLRSERQSVRARRHRDADRHAAELERRHALHDPARPRSVRRRVEELSDQLQFRDDPEWHCCPGVRARIRGRRQALDARRPLRPDHGGVQDPAHNVFTENTATIPIQIAFNGQDSRGIDGDLQIQVTPKWKISANAITQKAYLTAVPLTPSQIGNWPVGVPPHIFNLWTTYDFAIAGIDGFRVGGGLSYNDRTYASTADTAWIPPSTVADALVGYYAPHWDAQIGVKNITNVEYFTVAQSAGGFVGQPRTFYAKADWHY